MTRIDVTVADKRLKNNSLGFRVPLPIDSFCWLSGWEQSIHIVGADSLDG